MAETFTLSLDEVREIVNAVVSGRDRLYSLSEVAARTGWALTTLEDECRDGIIEHTKRGRSLGMTSGQIARLIARHAAGGDLAKMPAADDELEQIRSKTAQSGARRPSRGRAA